MPDFKYDWFTGNIAGLTKVLDRFKGKEHAVAIEIGCFEGRSAVWFFENILTHPTSFMYCIDHFQGGADHAHFGVDISGARERFEQNIKPWQYRCRLMDLESCEALKLIHPMPSGRKVVDFVYIDGDHRSQGVLEDAVLSWRLLKPGGILIFDDYLWKNMPEPLDNPGPGIDAFLSIYKGKYKELMRGYQIAIEKLA